VSEFTPTLDLKTPQVEFTTPFWLCSEMVVGVMPLDKAKLVVNPTVAAERMNGPRAINSHQPISCLILLKINIAVLFLS
jgi:hypothetical protein